MKNKVGRLRAPGAIGGVFLAADVTEFDFPRSEQLGTQAVEFLREQPVFANRLRMKFPGIRVFHDAVLEVETEFENPFRHLINPGLAKVTDP